MNPGLLERHQLIKATERASSSTMDKAGFKALYLTRNQWKAIPLWIPGTLLNPEKAKQFNPFKLRDIMGPLPSQAIRQPKPFFRRMPDRGLADLFADWTMQLMSAPYSSPLELMLSMSLLVGSFAFWEFLPQVIINVDPTAVLSPIKVAIMKHTMIENPKIC